MIDCVLIDPEARQFWKFTFEGKIEVPFDDFFTNLCEHLGVQVGSEIDDVNKRKCIEILACITLSNGQKIVSLDRFGLLLKWFGSLTFQTKNIIDKIFLLVSEKWFHGEMTRDQISANDSAYSDNKDFKGHFFVRFSQTEPIENKPFSITTYTGSESRSYHILFDISTGEYSVSFKDKKKKM